MNINTQTLLHIGAGHTAKLDRWLASGAESIVLIEPNPLLAEQLRHRTAGQPKVSIVEVAITTEPNKNRLYEYNVPNANSLNAAKDLKNLFPGLKTINSYNITTLSPSELFEKYGPKADQTASLVIEAAGEELSIIQALIASDQLKSFTHLLLTASLEPLYEGGVPAQDLLDVLQENGYDIIQQTQLDPDWASWELQRNSLKDQVNELHATLEAKSTVLAQEQETVQKLQTELEKLQQALAAEKEVVKKVTQDKQQASEAVQVAQHGLETFKAEHQAKIQALEKTVKAKSTAFTQEQETVQKQQTELEKLQQALATEKEAVKKVTQDKQQASETLQAVKLQLVEKDKKFSQYKKQLAQTQQKLNESIEQVEKQQLTNKKLEDIESKINKFSSDLDKKLDKKLVNTAKQIESTMGLQNYLISGELPLSYHGWPISPDLALYLTEKIETNNYDLIIEFGSGTSTVLFAKILINKARRIRYSNNHLENQASGLKQDYIEDAVIPNSKDLPKRVLTFEHNKSYHSQTMSRLKLSGLEQVVDLVHAPLIDYPYQGEDYLYYDCESALRKTAEVYEGREPHILVLVDGPPGSTGKNARFPVLPHLLNFLPKAKFDLLLDDYNRLEEKEIFEKWKDFLKKRSIDFFENQYFLEKGLGVLTF